VVRASAKVPFTGRRSSWELARASYLAAISYVFFTRPSFLEVSFISILCAVVMDQFFWLSSIPCVSMVVLLNVFLEFCFWLLDFCLS